MKVILTSDLHGSLPEIPECDLLLIGGDVCPVNNHALDRQSNWLDKEFRNWLKEVPAKHIVGIAGNHDFVFEAAIEEPGLIPPELRWTYLQDEDVTIEGVRIWGTPWVPNLRNWAFFGGYSECLDHFNDIPGDIDVLLSHGPIHGYGDVVPGAGHVGDLHMPEILREVQPRLFVCGHIHEGYGHYHHPDVERGIYNVAHMDRFYDPINAPVEIEL